MYINICVLCIDTLCVYIYIYVHITIIMFILVIFVIYIYIIYIYSYIYIYCHILSYIVIYCHILSYIVIYCHILSYIVIYCHILSYIVIYCLYVCVHVTSCWFRQPTGPNRLGAGNFRDQQRMCSLCGILRLPGPHWDLRLAWSSTGHLKLSERTALQNCHSASFAFTLPEQPMIECVDNVLKMRWLCVDM